MRTGFNGFIQLSVEDQVGTSETVFRTFFVTAGAGRVEPRPPLT